MKKIYITLITLTLILSGCAAPTHFNLKNDAIRNQSGGPFGTYSDYGSDIEYNKQEKIHQLSVFTGGSGGCDGGAIAYAKPKLDKYMKTNKFSSYTIVKGQYSLIPLSKCELYIRFE